MNRNVIGGLIFLMLLIVCGASGCSKGTVGTSEESCMQGHVQSTCPSGEVKCCLDGWVCCSENGENSCNPEAFCFGESVPSDPFVGS